MRIWLEKVYQRLAVSKRSMAYRKAAEYFVIAAKIQVTEADALYNWGNVLVDQSAAWCESRTGRASTLAWT